MPSQPQSERPIIFQMPNHHGPNSGQPPMIDGREPGRYYGYFQNEHGEQAVFVYTHATKTAELYMGDVGWEEVHQVIDGEAPEIVLTLQEAIWLQICWYAATGEMPSRMKRATGPAE
jgi:hypothetical protein